MGLCREGEVETGRKAVWALGAIRCCQAAKAVSGVLLQQEYSGLLFGVCRGCLITRRRLVDRGCSADNAVLSGPVCMRHYVAVSCTVTQLCNTPCLS